jgi:5-methylcytosine-specific restriction endonuclease McrA
MQFETSKCVVLNATYEPITVISSKRALILIMEDKATVIEEHPHLVVRSPSITVKVPTTVVLKRYIKGRKIFTTPAGLSQKNLYIRDNYTCQYCLRHRNELTPKEFLTRDHIVPESRGGSSTWENLVTACSTCNNKKGNHNLSSTGMVLAKKPNAPMLFELWMKNNKSTLHFDFEQ